MAALPNHVRKSVEELIQQLNANHIRIQKAYIFGSYAKGKQTQWSDIDLALVSEEFEGNFYYDRQKIIPYLIKAKHYIEAHPFSPTDFTHDNPFVEEILETGMRVV